MAESLAVLMRKRDSLTLRLRLLKTILLDAQKEWDDDDQVPRSAIAFIKHKRNACLPLLDEFENIQNKIEFFDTEEINLEEETTKRQQFDELYRESVLEATYFLETVASVDDKGLPGIENTVPMPSSQILSTVGTTVTAPPLVTATVNTPAPSLVVNDSIAANNPVQQPPVSGQIINDSSPHVAVGNLKLPTIPLPTFSGNFNEWLEFRDTYDSLIHRNNSVSNIQKFHYLKGALQGDAKLALGQISFSSGTYNLAWDHLCQVYNNNDKLVFTHIKALFEINKVTHKSSAKLRELIDTVTKNLQALNTLGQPTDHWDTIIIYLLTTKLDHDSLLEWESYKTKFDLVSLADLTKFIRDRAIILDRVELNKSAGSSQMSKTPPKIEKHHFRRVANISTTPKHNCSVCGESHYIHLCKQFLDLTPQNRLAKARDLKLCVNCLRPGHMSNECRSGACKHCSSKHNSLLHFFPNGNAAARTTAPANSSNNAGTNSATLSGSIAFNSNYADAPYVILSTICAQVSNSNSNQRSVRALLDGGSQSNFITRTCCDKLGLKTYPVECSISGIGRKTCAVNRACNLTLKSAINAFTLSIKCLIIPEITDWMPTIVLDRNQINIPQNIVLADPNFSQPGEIDLLIGAEHYVHLLCIGQVSLGAHNPILQKTRFGWIVTGAYQAPTQHTQFCHFTNVQLNNQLQKFWEVEECHSVPPPYSKEETICETNFQATTIRNSDGRFEVTLPLKHSPNVLGESKQRAERQFLSLERRFQSDPVLKALYTDFMEEYISLDHMSETVENDTTDTSYFIPHHGVFKDNSSTTKLRAVFNASSPTSTGYSLNDIMLAGPVIQSDLMSILLRFRTYKVVLSADIAKMYRQVEIHPSQRVLQQIFWRADPSLPLKIYTLNTVTYGTVSASFLAIRCLFQLALDCEFSEPTISKLIKEDFYVDDLLTGCESVEEAKIIVTKIFQILNSGCFELRKWISNYPESLETINPSQGKSEPLNFGQDGHIHLLGLSWSHERDVLSYNVSLKSNTKITKRVVLSSVAKIFDPLGLLSPSTIVIKMLMQQLWQEKIDWDGVVPASIRNTWLKFYNELSAFLELKIVRNILCDNWNNIQLHAFSDASQKAYGACVYIVSSSNFGKRSALLCAKGKVAPIKALTIPRLELCGALLLIRLVNKVIKSLRINIQEYVFWCDSTIVLSWLKISPSQLKPFVSSRITEILDHSTNDQWRYVPSADNPADHITRGVFPSNLGNLNCWWNGPSWLLDRNRWPDNQKSTSAELPELRKVEQKTLIVAQSSNLVDFNKYSSFSKLQRVTAYCLRFLHNLTNTKSDRLDGVLSPVELETALQFLVKSAQAQTFCSGLSDAQRRCASLNPFMDAHNIIRVGGRLENSAFTFSQKHPMILCSKHPLSRLIVKHYHVKMFHLGPHHLFATTRQKFWILNGRNLVRSVVKKCLRCFKAKPTFPETLMGQLPSARVNIELPFAISGVDYAGPFLIKDRKGRGCKTHKVYACLFICFVVKAVHIELVSDLTSEGFIRALRNFVSRRGKPKEIHSDNATNFTGANSSLKELGQFLIANEKSIATTLASDDIIWKFIPPRSPHFGSLWEANIKSVKYHLVRIAGNVLLTYEELNSLLIQIEGLLNSRPLTIPTSNPHDLSPLTPAHFLIGRRMEEIPDPNLSHLSENRLSRYQLIQRLKQHFFARWKREYLVELQKRAKWTTEHVNVAIGDVVLLKDENTSSLLWKLGEVIEVHPGEDGFVRVVTVRTPHGIFKRSVTKICPLPREDS